MKKRWSVLFLYIIVSSCNYNETKQNLNFFITDKIWITPSGEYQLYFNSKNNTQYIWHKTLNIHGEKTNQFSLAKGTPKTNPFIKNDNEEINEGWSKMYHFKIVGDSIVFQNEDDFNGKNIRKQKIEILNDTTIGIFEYTRIKVTSRYLSTIWKSKK